MVSTVQSPKILSRGRATSNRSLRKQMILGLLSYILGVVAFQVFHGASFDLQFVSQIECENSRVASAQIKTSKDGDISNHKKWAYAFLISGCDPTSPLTYRPYLWNILVATTNLRETGSKADVVVMVQMARQQGANATAIENPNMAGLPAGDLQWLNMYNETIRVHYLPPLIRDNFYNAQLAKFHILELTDYSRVLYLDSDLMPLCNLDYLFQLSEQGSLQPNVVLAWFTEPSHGGFFLLKPGNFEGLQKVLERREKEALTLPYPHWDPVSGWGHPFQEEWYGLPQPLPSGLYGPPRHSTNWTFHGDFADQGLLYYWTRFHEQAVSVVYLDKVLDYVGEGGKLSRTRQSKDTLGEFSNGCLPKGMEFFGHYGSTLQDPLFLKKVPHRDFCHFSGEGKPWEIPYKQFPIHMSHVQSSTDYWYYQLGKVFREFEKYHPERKLPSLPLKYKKPALGRYPTHRGMIGSIQKKLRQKQGDQTLL